MASLVTSNGSLQQTQQQQPLVVSSSTSSAAAGGGGTSSTSTTTTTTLPIWDIPEASQLEPWIRSTLTAKVPIGDAVQKATVASLLWKHLFQAVNSLTVTIVPIVKKEGNEEEDKDVVVSTTAATGRPAKRSKKNNGNYKKKQSSIRQDPYSIWLHEQVDEDAEYDDVPSTFGGKLAQLTVAGLMNALSGIKGGIVEHYKKIVPRSSNLIMTDHNSGSSTTTTTVGNTQLTFVQIHQVATGLFRSIETRVQQDVLVTTPIRIQQMLAPELQSHEFKAIRKRIYDTVILGKGMNQNHPSSTTGDEDNDEMPVVASATTNIHDIEKMKKCKVCGNNDQSSFILDRKNGDVICSNCGTVVSESLMHEGSQYRKFEGEQDRNHHGDSANPLYSNAHNMSTTLSGIQVTAGAGGPGFGAMRGTGGRGLETILRNAHAYTELNISQFGRDEKRTRIGYKDKQKKEAFVQMAHIGDALNLHEAVIQRAKELFSGFRDDREMVQQFKGVIAACLCEAFDQLSSDGKRILKQQEVLDNRVVAVAGGGGPNAGNNGRTSQARASRRNELHHASLAGKGGLLLDLTTVKSAPNAAVVASHNNESTASNPAASPTPSNAGAAAGTGTTQAPASALEDKPISLWHLDDCRTWLLEVSRTIAEQWYEAGRAMKLEGGTAADKASKIPRGTREELEGRLVEHTFTLCDQLEQEMKNRTSNSTTTVAATTSINKRVITPRVNDMSRLGIKWQHAHERGSGGKGGVGNNAAKIGTSAAAAAAAAASTATIGSTSSNSGGATAGQILLLKTAKKLGTMLNDDIVGEAFHRELRTIYARQEARKKKELRDEATRQRFQQMKRKPWLQARIEQK